MKKYKRKFLIFKKIIGTDAPIIVEVGAHYGEDTLRFLETFPRAKVYCFEPDPRNIKIFESYVKDDRVVLSHSALAATEGKAEFFQSYEELQDNRVPEKYDWIDLEDYKQEQINSSGASSLKKGHKDILPNSIVVKTERFDNWHRISGVGTIDLLWIDVQGAEADVIEGMGEAAQHVKLVWIEYGETQYQGALTRLDTVRLMKEKGFAAVNELSDHGAAGDLLFKRI